MIACICSRYAAGIYFIDICVQIINKFSILDRFTRNSAWREARHITT